MEYLYCVIYLVSISLIVWFIGRIFPRKWIRENAFPFRSFAFEKGGKIYEKIKIRKWKTKFPDASVLLHKIIKKIPIKRMENRSANKVSILIKESCVAEATHVIALVLGFVCLRIKRGFGGAILSILYALPNIPPILIQRYNRPRLKKALDVVK